jgi:hypothetical protein
MEDVVIPIEFWNLDSLIPLEQKTNETISKIEQVVLIPPVADQDIPLGFFEDVPNTLVEMPRDMINVIASYLEPTDIISLFQVCKLFRGMVGHNEMIIKINDAYTPSGKIAGGGSTSEWDKTYMFCHGCSTTIHRKNIDRHKTKCKNHKPSCYLVHSKQIEAFKVVYAWSLTSSDIKAKTNPGLNFLGKFVTVCSHKKSCPFTSCVCQYCNISFRRYLLKNHSDCESVVEECSIPGPGQGCGYRTTRKLMINHYLSCPHQSAWCDRCGKGYIIKDRDEHAKVCIRKPQPNFFEHIKRDTTLGPRTKGSTTSAPVQNRNVFSPLNTRGSTTPGSYLATPPGYMNLSLSYYGESSSRDAPFETKFPPLRFDEKKS